MRLARNDESAEEPNAAAGLGSTEWATGSESHFAFKKPESITEARAIYFLKGTAGYLGDLSCHSAESIGAALAA